MCRNILITDRTLTEDQSRLLLLTAFLAANADGQKSGFGLSNGVVIRKSKEQPRDAVHDVLRMPLVGNVLQGHVRSASPGTSLTDAESHPFQFRDWTAAHNGGFGPWKRQNQFVPNSDSYDAFTTLQSIDNGELKTDTLNRWLSAMNASSKFVCTFLRYDGSSVIVRGDHQREMHFFPLNNGWCFATTYILASVLRGLALSLDIAPAHSIIVSQPEHSVIRVDRGGVHLSQERLSYTLIPLPAIPTKKNVLLRLVDAIKE